MLSKEAIYVQNNSSVMQISSILAADGNFVEKKMKKR